MPGGTPGTAGEDARAPQGMTNVGREFLVTGLATAGLLEFLQVYGGEFDAADERLAFA